MAHNSVPQNTVPVTTSSGLANRRGGHNIAPLSFNVPGATSGPAVRQSHAHLLAGLRTAPRSATDAHFPAYAGTAQVPRHNSMSNNIFANGPRTSLPFITHHQQMWAEPGTQSELQMLHDQMLRERLMQETLALHQHRVNIINQIHAAQSQQAAPPQQLVYELNAQQQGAAQQFASHMSYGGYAFQPAPQMPQTVRMEQPAIRTPRVEVSPPPAENTHSFSRNSSPDTPGHRASFASTTSASGQMRRGLTINSRLAQEGGRSSAGPFTPLMPGQARAGEHPSREPRRHVDVAELKQSAAANFAHYTRRSALSGLVAGTERRRGNNNTSAVSGGMSPPSLKADDYSGAHVTDNDSDSGRSGSWVLADVPKSGSQRSSWGPIGSDRPFRNQQQRREQQSPGSSGSATSPCDSDASFIGMMKSSLQPAERI